MAVKPTSDEALWLFSRRVDFWLLCGGASVGLIAAILVIYWHGDREIDAPLRKFELKIGELPITRLLVVSDNHLLHCDVTETGALTGHDRARQLYG